MLNLRNRKNGSKFHIGDDFSIQVGNMKKNICKVRPFRFSSQSILFKMLSIC